MANNHPLHLRRLRLMALITALGSAGCDVSNNNGEVTVHDGDPAVVDFPIAYVHRPLPLMPSGDLDGMDFLEPAAFHPGAKLMVRDRASASAHERVITDDLFADQQGGSAAYDVKDLSVSADGSQLLFALRAPAVEGDDQAQPDWDIWQYNFAESNLWRVIDTGGDDVDPHFLPDGGIVFSSNRQLRSRAILTDELKPQYSGLDDKRNSEGFALHTWHLNPQENKEVIQQITFNVSHDLQPTVLDDGRLLFVRHDGIGRHNRISLYSVNQDGSDLQPYYGYHSQNTGTDDSATIFMRPQVLPDGRLLVKLQGRDAGHLGGDIIAIDGANFTDFEQPISANTGSGDTGQQSLTQGQVDTSESAVSPAGRYHSAYPFYDGTRRLLTSWSPCRLRDATTGALGPCDEQTAQTASETAQPLYGLWIYNPDTDTQLPIEIPEEGYMYSDVVVMAPTPSPAHWQANPRNAELVTDAVGTVHIRSVYDIDGEDEAPGGLAAVADPTRTAVDERPVRFLRIVKNVPIPSDDVFDVDRSAFGRSAGMRDIIGYVPVEPDGSVLFKVPADIAFTFDLLDAEGKRVSARHDNWLHVRPGEERQCTGCHTRSSTEPHGRRDAEPDSINPGAGGGVAFMNNRLVDEFGVPQPYPEFGETMAQYYARIYGPRTPSADLVFVDEWTDSAVATQGADIRLRYIDIATELNRTNTCNTPAEAEFDWSAPSSCLASDAWSAQCRSTINYLDTIMPLWQADRRLCGDFGEVITDNTCTSCHTRTRDGLLQVPAGQLELTGETSLDRGDYVTSYVELLFNDNEQQLSGGSLTDTVVEVETGRSITDAEGQPVLDENGQQIPLIEQRTVPVAAPMSADGAQASTRFFSVFQEQGSHAGMLSEAELRLIAEWLDIGGQYYNNPFDAPAN